MNSDSVLKLENVFKSYVMGKIRLDALKGVSLEIGRGSFLAIAGPSGSGKSTLLNILGCIDVPSTGKVFLAGQDITKLSENDLAQVRGKKIGFIFQQFNLLSNLNALENVMLPMIFQGIGESARRQKAENALKEVGLGDRMHHRPAELSGGEQQRVAIARALVNDPDIIVADEPTGNLDSKSGQKIIEILLQFYNKENKTIIMVTHDQAIADYAKTIIHIKDGQLVDTVINNK